MKPSNAADASKVALLYVRGGDDADRVQQTAIGFRWSGTTDLFQLVKGDIPAHRLQVTRSMLRNGLRPDLSQYTCVLNLIAEAERNSRSLDNLRKILRGYKGKVVNRPDAVLRTTRDQIARLLQGIENLVVPRVIRLPAAQSPSAKKAIDRAGLRFPVILRQAGTHGGKIVGCFETAEALAAAIERGPDYIVTEFFDFRSEDGFYRKIRAFVIGGHRIIRHQLVSDHWNVHAKDRVRFMATRPELVAEERRMFERDGDPLPQEVSQVLDDIRLRMPLDFFGIDFGVARDGSVVLFEANAAMSFFPLSDDPQFAYLRRALPPAQRAFRKMLGLSEQSSRLPKLAGLSATVG